MEYVEFNLNDEVLVRLTDHGRRIHREQFNELKSKYPGIGEYSLKEDADGWSKWQMWVLMRDFGQHIGMGIEQPFETNVKIVVSK